MLTATKPATGMKLSLPGEFKPSKHRRRPSGARHAIRPQILELENRRLLSGLETIASFNGAGMNGDGANPYGVVTPDANGNLWGATASGGAYNDGTVWEITASNVASGTITTIASFDGAGPIGNGSGPYGVTFDASGDLFGTAASGGANGDGTVWEITANNVASGTITTLASFDGTNGANPSGGVTLDANNGNLGNLFGTTINGGPNSDGTVWEIKAPNPNLNNNPITTLASFNGTNGSGPNGAAFDANGDLFGTTNTGGVNNNNDGTAWEITASSLQTTPTITTLASFNGTTDGSGPNGATIDADGNLFGTTGFGGANGFGTVWEITTWSNTITPLASFTGVGASGDGETPFAGVTIDANGDLFGTADGGGTNGSGVVWEITASSLMSTPAIATLASFNGTNGSGPYGGVTLDANGNLFGTTQLGGANADGTVWEIPGVSVPAAYVTIDASNSNGEINASLGDDTIPDGYLYPPTNPATLSPLYTSTSFVHITNESPPNLGAVNGQAVYSQSSSTSVIPVGVVDVVNFNIYEPGVSIIHGSANGLNATLSITMTGTFDGKSRFHHCGLDVLVRHPWTGNNSAHSPWQ